MPQDFFLAVFSGVVDGGVLVKALLILGLWFAGWGAARLAAAVLDVGLGGQLVAVTIAVWNPYVAERLLQGHWSLLVGYGCLPWVALSSDLCTISRAHRGFSCTNHRKLRRRKLFETTKNDEKAIAAPAISGLSRPAAATGMAAML